MVFQEAGRFLSRFRLPGPELGWHQGDLFPRVGFIVTDPNTIFVTIGDTTPGRIGAVMRSGDTGKSWETMNLPVDPNTAMWVVNIQPGDPQVVFAGSRYGYL